MIRRVAYRKAMLAGALGALAWDLALRAAIATSWLPFDLVFLLGTLVAPPDRAWLWYPIGLALHLLVGSLWALVYAYFFWALFPWSPTWQGVAFSVIPWLVAIGAMLPQLATLHPLIARGALPAPGFLALNYGWRGPFEALLGHLIYGAVLGSLYRRPVGHPVHREPVAAR